MLDDADGHPEEAVDAAHPLRVAAGQVVVHGDDVDALAFERVEVGGQRGDQRLAFAGLHLGDLAAVEDHAADHLDVEMPHVERAAPGLADDGEGLGQQIVERLAVGQPRAEFRGLGAQLLVGELPDLRLDGVDRDHERREPFQFALVLRAYDFREESVDDHAGELRSGYQMIVRDRLAAVNQPTGMDPALCGGHGGRGDGLSRAAEDGDHAETVFFGPPWTQPTERRYVVAAEDADRTATRHGCVIALLAARNAGSRVRAAVLGISLPGKGNEVAT